MAKNSLAAFAPQDNVNQQAIGLLDQGIDHRLTKPRTPQTNGMIERFNGRIADVLATTRFDSAKSLEETITRYVDLYNQHIPQKALGHIPPINAMKKWYKNKPQLFIKRVYNHTGLDTYAIRHTFMFFRCCSFNGNTDYLSW